MGHFAKVENDTVINVIIAEQDFINTLPDSNTWIQTSYNTYGNIHYDPDTRLPDGKPALRGNYAVIGGTYDKANDVFYSKKPYPSWTLNKNTWLWEAPVSYPTDGKSYIWNENDLTWINY